ncbi:Zinc finger protein 57 [Papilio machaon]|uniref:Zinc finger protein 57 n=1 Tax=Papilio machaon TaxID=76193 RepID=A0A0N1IP96_PAPMA|nr:Zinc finger protein 57 [Papilio machaon]
MKQTIELKRMELIIKVDRRYSLHSGKSLDAEGGGSRTVEGIGKDSANTMGLNFDTFHERMSDSEDDIPLIAIGSRKIKKNTKTIKKRRNKDCKDNKVDAKEIELTEEEQRLELLERATSDNYLKSPYKCEKCYKGFVDPQAFTNHMEKHEKVSTLRVVAHMNVLYVNLDIQVVDSCEHMSRLRMLVGIPAQNALIVPIPDIKPEIMRNGTTDIHILEKENSEDSAAERFCSDCNIQFLNLNAWKKHVLTSYKHTMRNDNSNCNICGVTVTSENRSSHMRNHMRELRPSVPAPEVPATPALQCSQCEGQFISRSRLQAHVRRVHLGLKYDKNVVCEMCGKKCTVHSGARPYACTQCTKCFSQSNSLKLHVRTVHLKLPHVRKKDNGQQ